MIDSLDEALRQLLIQELPIQDDEIDIAFDQPSQDWSSRLARPTLNLFLYVLHENKVLRSTQPLWDQQIEANGKSATWQRRPMRLDLQYLVTAWATEPEDEHRLLGRSLMALSRYPHLPEELTPDWFKTKSKPIPLTVAQEEHLKSPQPSDLWSALENKWRPGFTCLVTVEVDMYQPFSLPLVHHREVAIGQAAKPDRRQLTAEPPAGHFWTIGGNLHTDRPLEEIGVRLVETGLDIPVLPDGRFVVGKLKAGDYTLEIRLKDSPPRRHKIVVPAADYEIVV